MNARRARAALRALTLLSTLASSLIGIMFVLNGGGMPFWLRALMMIPLVLSPVLVARLVLRPLRAKERESRMALREAGSSMDRVVQEDKTIVLIKQKRTRRY